MRPWRCAIDAAEKKPRNPRVEVLRLVAIVAIAVFHTFQPWFSAAVDPASDWAIAYPWLQSAPVRAILGCINLLGAYGNDVFFLISGYFLLPRAIGQPHQTQATLRRVGVILVSVALYALLALGIDALVIPIDGVGLDDLGWLLEGLEFIWVYLAAIIITPTLALLARRAKHRRGIALVAILATLCLNAYIAFFSPGDAERGLLEWRKLMSAVTYLMAYVAGALMATSKKQPSDGRKLLLVTIVACVLVEACLALLEMPEALVATSFKSTSMLSFALAVASMAYATSREAKRVNYTFVRYASSILGFYIVQSMTSGWWRPLFEVLTSECAAAGFGALLLSGVILSFALICGIIVIDQALRIRLLRKLKLA